MNKRLKPMGPPNTPKDSPGTSQIKSTQLPVVEQTPRPGSTSNQRGRPSTLRYNNNGPSSTQPSSSERQALGKGAKGGGIEPTRKLNSSL